LIERRTTFVIGAGASYELGLPLGEGLKQDIRPLLNLSFDDLGRFKGRDSDLYRTLLVYQENKRNITFQELVKKCWMLSHALPAAISIDNLLDAHRDDEHIAFIGKVAIAKAVIQAERSSTLYWDQSKRDDFDLSNATGSWLIPLFQKLTENIPKQDATRIFDNVSFVVFNYDRCLEFFLPRALSTYYGFNDQEAKQIASSARIYHPYGQVGALDHGHSQGIASFGDTKANLAEVANRIRTFTEGLRYDSHRDTIRAEIESSENVVFLGFAFHPLNMRVLQVPSGNRIRRIFGTTIGLADAAVRRVREDVYLTFNKRPDDGKSAALDYLDEVNFEARGARDFLYAHFRSLE
jgi:hypothetical protein